MLTEKILNILNEQVKKEMYSSNLYLAMAIWADSQGYNGTAQWLYAQSDEEHDHMMMFVHYINDKGGKAIIPAIDMPPSEFKDLKNLFNEVLKHEQYITESIHEIVALTIEEKDYSTNSWIQFFVKEQIEEEKSVQEILDKLKLVGGNNLYMFDRDVASLRNEN